MSEQMNLARYMEAQGLTDEDVAYHLRVKANTVYRWRTGRSEPTRRRKIKIRDWTRGVVGLPTWDELQPLAA